MSPADALALLTARLDRIEDSVAARVGSVEAKQQAAEKEYTAVVTELRLMRKSVDRFTNALLVGAVSIITTSVTILLFFRI